jgi:4-diphosphocytidyl-2-C-methyl-D-erythritol kinase
VAFAGLCDWLAFEPGGDLTLEVLGPRAAETGPVDDNLVLRAAWAFAALIPRLVLGRFRLVKRLPAAAGLGGGSADAAAALRLIANAARLSLDDSRVRDAAKATGADVLACLCPQARMMTGIGDQLGPLIPLRLFAVLVNPLVPAPTPKVFDALGLAPGSILRPSAEASVMPGASPATIADFVALNGNDLEAAAVRVAPAIATVRQRLARISTAIATGMSGSGATCFALFHDRRSAMLARNIVAGERPDWWVEATAIS